MSNRASFFISANPKMQHKIKRAVHGSSLQALPIDEPPPTRLHRRSITDAHPARLSALPLPRAVNWSGGVMCRIQKNNISHDIHQKISPHPPIAL